MAQKRTQSPHRNPRASIISKDKNTTWGEERGFSKNVLWRKTITASFHFIRREERREEGTSVEVDKFFYSRKAEKVTVPSLEGKKKKRKKRRRWGTSNETGPRITMEIRFVPFLVRTYEIFSLFFTQLFCLTFPWFITINYYVWRFSIEKKKRKKKKRIDITAIDESRGWNKSLWNRVSICLRQIHAWSLMNGGQEVDT